MAAVLISIRQPATLIKGAQFKAANGDALVFADVCTDGGVIVGPRSGFSRQIEDAVEEYATHCLGSLEYN